jgi:hypothetical protein
MKDRDKIWESKASAHDYAAAEKYLALLFSDRDAKRLVRSLKAAPTREYYCKGPSEVISDAPP